MNLRNEIESYFKNSIANVSNILQDEQLLNNSEKLIQLIIHTYDNNGAIFIAGNGGSASDAQHLSAELVVKFKKQRKALKAISLNTDTSILTAIGNDFGYEYLFSRQLEALANENDLFFALTTSGNSPNIIEALKYCKKAKVISVLFSGFDGGKSKLLADHILIAPGSNTAQIQECHVVIYHMLCSLIDEVFDEVCG